MNIGGCFEKENLVIVYRKYLFIYFHGEIYLHFIIHRGKSLIGFQNALIYSFIFGENQRD